MNQNPYNKAAGAYQGLDNYGLDARQGMMQIMMKLMRQITDAQNAHRARKLDEMCTINAKTFSMLLRLCELLEVDESAPDAKLATETNNNINSIYMEVFQRLANVLRAPSPDAEFTSLIARIHELYKVWETLGEPTKPTTEAKESARVG